MKPVVFYNWINNAKNPEDFEYDVITGISIGAINGLGLAQFPKGKESEAADYLISTWRNISQRDVFKSWPGGLIDGLFFKQSLFDNDPEIDFLRNNIKIAPNKRMITVAATDFSTGEKVTFSEKELG